MRVRVVFWKLISVLFPVVRDTLLFLGIIWHTPGRQRFALGFITPGKTPEELAAYLQAHGFDNHFIAWVDEGELYSVRKIASDPRYQYHLRIFKDGEVRGHYEFTPEAHPIFHFTERDVEERREDFLAFLGEFIVPSVPEKIPAGMHWPLTGKIRRE